MIIRAFLLFTFFKKKTSWALSSVAPLVGCHPVHLKVIGSIPVRAQVSGWIPVRGGRVGGGGGMQEAAK